MTRPVSSERVEAQPRNLDPITDQKEAGHEKTDQAKRTRTLTPSADLSGERAIADLPGVTLLDVEIVPPAGRRTQNAMLSRSCACGTLHFFRKELGVRRTPCGRVVVLVEAGEVR